MKEKGIAVAAGMVAVAAIAVGISASQSQPANKEENVIQAMYRALENNSNPRDVAAQYVFADFCQVIVPQPVQIAFDRYTRAHSTAVELELQKLKAVRDQVQTVPAAEQIVRQSVCPKFKGKTIELTEMLKLHQEN